MLRHAQTLVSNIFRFANSSDVQATIIPRPSVCEQRDNECAFHVVANGVLAQEERCFTHTFDQTYVTYIRDIHIQHMVENSEFVPVI